MKDTKSSGKKANEDLRQSSILSLIAIITSLIGAIISLGSLFDWILIKNSVLEKSSNIISIIEIIVIGAALILTLQTTVKSLFKKDD